jgi:hypothetical protein
MLAGIEEKKWILMRTYFIGAFLSFLIGISYAYASCSCECAGGPPGNRSYARGSFPDALPVVDKQNLCREYCITASATASAAARALIRAEPTIGSTCMRPERTAGPPPPVVPEPTFPSLCSNGEKKPLRAIAGTIANLQPKGGVDHGMSCVPVPVGKSLTNTYCKLFDDWGEHWCRFDLSDGDAACDYWGNPTDNPMPAYYPDRSTGGWQFCMNALNNAKDERHRHFQLFGVTEPPVRIKLQIQPEFFPTPWCLRPPCTK